jgi:hypothetical protein
MVSVTYVDQDRDLERQELIEGSDTPKDDRNARPQPTDRVAGVLDDVVPGEGARPLGAAHGRGQDRLVDDERRASISAHSVDHSDERGREDDGEGRGAEDDESARRAEQGQHHERAAAAKPIPGQRDDERRRGGSEKPGTDHGARLSGIEPTPAEVDADEHAHHAGRERAQERGGVEELSVTHRIGLSTNGPR